MSDWHSDRELVARVRGGDRYALRSVWWLSISNKVASLVSQYISGSRRGHGCRPGGVSEGLSGAAGVPRRECFLHLALIASRSIRLKNHLVAQGRRPPPGDDVEADVAEHYGDGGAPAGAGYAGASSAKHGDSRDGAGGRRLVGLRTTVLLRELEGRSYEEVANAMECLVGTVCSRIFRAREAIEKRLRPLHEPRGKR